MPDNIERIVQRDLDQLPLLPPERWIPTSKPQARTAPSWLRPLAFVPATLVIVVVALAAGTQLAEWRAQREPAAGQTAIAPIPGPLALAGGAPSSGFGLLSSGMNSLLVRSETSEDTLFPIAGGSQAAVSPNGRSIAAWTRVPETGVWSLRVYDTIDRSVGPTLLTAHAENPIQTLWASDGSGIIAGTQTPVTRGGLDGSRSQPIHTSWFAVDFRTQSTELPTAFASAVATVHAWDRQRDLITGSGFSGSESTFTTLSGGQPTTNSTPWSGRVVTSLAPHGSQIAAADTYGRSVVLLSYGACGTGSGAPPAGSSCPVFEIRDQASFTTMFSFSPFMTGVKEARLVFRPRSQDLIAEYVTPIGESRVELLRDLGRSQPRVLASYTAAARFPDLILPRVDGSAAFLLKFDSNPNAPRWFGELVSLSDDSRSAFEIRTGGNPLASVVLDPTFAAMLAGRATTPGTSTPPPTVPTPGVSTPSRCPDGRPQSEITAAGILPHEPRSPLIECVLIAEGTSRVYRLTDGRRLQVFEYRGGLPAKPTAPPGLTGTRTIGSQSWFWMTVNGQVVLSTTLPDRVYVELSVAMGSNTTIGVELNSPSGQALVNAEVDLLQSIAATLRATGP